VCIIKKSTYTFFSALIASCLVGCANPYKIPDDPETNEKMKKVYFSLVGDPQTVIDIGNLGIDHPPKNLAT